ncbi:tyrosine aminotransferase [Photinus pyralis]|uniref:tyrosine aminotransferase n=1 Tax=Photinus pyralis TaxID=7054 RepID=UPI0012673637|nr:tyrosine aminotransferase [Photinus pyralis]
MLDSVPKDKTQKVIPNGCTDKEWKVTASEAAKNCKNYIRDIVDNLVLEPNPEKSLIALSIGDPTVYGNLEPPNEVVQAVLEAVTDGKYNGYGPTVGTDESRKAVAKYLSFDGVEYDFKDVILCSGCSSSLDLCITALADSKRGHNIVIPKPGFTIYKTLAESFGVEVRNYNLLPEYDWMIDLAHLEAQIDNNTAAIVVNNPSNPCGSVFTEEHLKDILDIAYKYKVPIIADEIYERLVFSETRFVSIAAVNSRVPVLVCGGLAKRFLVPGWRLGWILFNDPIGAFDSEVRKGLTCLSQKTIGSNSLVQGALPKILELTPQSFYDDLNNTLYQHAKLAYDILAKIDGLTPYMPAGTMYMMIKIEIQCFPQFRTGLELMQRLMEEESVFCLPGECFGISGFMRIVLTVPFDMLKEACERMSAFCIRHYQHYTPYDLESQAYIDTSQ